MSALAGRCWLQTLDHAEDERIAGAVPLERLKLLFLHYLLQLVEAADLVARYDCRDDEEEALEVEADEEAVLAIELLLGKVNICQIRILLLLLLLLHIIQLNFILSG